MARGRKPKPVEIRKREGNQEHRPLPAVVNLGTFSELEPPAGLSDVAKDFWKRTVPTLKAVGLLSDVDFAGLEAMATMYARAIEARKQVERDGIISFGAQGQPKEAPAVKIERESWAAFQRIASEYALTPVARTRLGLAELQGRKMAEEMSDLTGGPPTLEAVK